MKQTLLKLAQVATELDRLGKKESADSIDRIMRRLAMEDSKKEYSVSVVHDISVPEKVFAKYDDPSDIPDADQRYVNTTVTVFEKEGYELGKPLQKKTFRSPNLTEARRKSDPISREWKILYVPSVGNERLNFM